MTQAPQNAPGGPRSRTIPTGDPKPDDTPEPQHADTTPPDWLGADARPAWDAAVALLTAVRIVARSDLTALARYCKLLTEWISLTKDIDANGHTIEDRFGQPKLNPAVSARDQIERSIRALEKALGLDPQSYMDLTKDLSKALTGRQKAYSGRRVGGFLNKKGGT